jgi:hypothetical protein
MNPDTLEEILLVKLTDLANQTHFHFENGNQELLEIVMAEAYSITQAYDNGEEFLYVPDIRGGWVSTP